MYLTKKLHSFTLRLKRKVYKWDVEQTIGKLYIHDEMMVYILKIIV